MPPGMFGERVGSIGFQILYELPTFFGGEARCDANVMERSLVVVESEQERADSRFLPSFVPSKPGDDAVAVALVLHFQHDALVRFVNAGRALRHDAVESGAFETL